jgi:hypothetical protein
MTSVHYKSSHREGKGHTNLIFLTCMRDEYKGYQFVIFAPSTSSFLSINNLGTEVFCLEIEHVKKKKLHSRI